MPSAATLRRAWLHPRKTYARPLLGQRPLLGPLAAVRESAFRPGVRFDLLDDRGNRLGWGRVTALGDIELFDAASNRLGNIRPTFRAFAGNGCRAKTYAPPIEALKEGETLQIGPDGKRGVWRSIGGNPVFVEVKQGESVPKAIKRIQKEKEKGGQQERSVTRGEGPFPIIERSPTSFLVEGSLRDANLPDQHLDRLLAIRFMEGSLIQAKVGTEGKLVEAYGIYEPTNHEITLASNAQSQQDDRAARMGTENIAVFGGQVILHEIGHHVHISRLTNDVADAWAHLSQNGQRARISSYARTSAGEHFAEVYREYARGGQHRARLKELEPGSYKFIQKVFQRRDWFLPDGETADLSTFDRRYGRWNA